MKKKIESAYEAGKRAESFAQRSLWRRNFRVKDVSSLGFGCDLVVNGSHRIEVKSMRGNSTNFALDPRNFHFLCVVVLGKLQNLAYYMRSEDMEKIQKKNSPGVYEVNVEILKNKFTRNLNDLIK